MIKSSRLQRADAIQNSNGAMEQLQWGQITTGNGEPRHAPFYAQLEEPLETEEPVSVEEEVKEMFAQQGGSVVRIRDIQTTERDDIHFAMQEPSWQPYDLPEIIADGELDEF
jgi:hypothetical protein